MSYHTPSKHEDYLQPDFYRFSEDSLYLIKTILEEQKLHDHFMVLDAGAGSGVVGLELWQKSKVDFTLHAVEVQDDFYPFLRHNFLQYGPSHASIFMQHLSEMKDSLYDLVISNPPYFHLGHGLLSPDQAKNRCRFFIDSSAENFFNDLKSRLKPDGTAFVLIREDQPISLRVMHHLGAKTIKKMNSCMIMRLSNEN